MDFLMYCLDKQNITAFVVKVMLRYVRLPRSDCQHNVESFS